MPATTAPAAPDDDQPPADLFIPVQQVDGTPQWGHEYVWVSYTTAEKWLEEYGQDDAFRNRKVNVADRRRLAHLMSTNRFVHFLPSSPFCFDEHGILINGKTRLGAVVESRKTVGFVVYRGVPRWMHPFMDLQRKKTEKDVLYATYKEDKPAIVATMKTAWRFEEVLAGARPVTGWRAWGRLDDLQPVDLDRMYETRPELVDYYGSAMAVRRGCKLVPQALMIFMMYQWHAWPEGRDVQESFLEQLREGTGFYKGSSAQSLYNFGRNEYCPTEARPVIHLLLLFRHFRAFAEKEPISQVRIAYGHQLELPWHPADRNDPAAATARANITRALTPLGRVTGWR